MMNKVFRNQLGWVAKIYLDDMIMKSRMDQGHVTSLNEVITEAPKNNLRLNPGKCTFSIQVRKFLGLYLTKRRIEANPDKCRVVAEMQPFSVRIKGDH